MHQKRSRRFAGFVVTHAGWIVLAWLVVAGVCRWSAPSWKEVALDGDFAYLPADRPSVAGANLLDEAFGQRRSRSQMVIVEAKVGGQLREEDQLLNLDLLRRLYHRLGEVYLYRADEITTQPIGTDRPGRSKRSVGRMRSVDGKASQTPLSANEWLELADQAFTQSLKIDADFYERLADRVPEDAPTLTQPRMAIAYWDRAEVRNRLGREADTVADDLEAALVLAPDIAQQVVAIDQRPLEAWTGLLDVFSWQDRAIGAQLRRPDARLVVLSLSSELAATSNIVLLAAVQNLIDDVTRYAGHYTRDSQRAVLSDSRLLVTGSAAIGGQTLSAARSAITYTEWFTVGMILLILAVVYRAPLLVAVPLLSIAIAVIVSTAVVTILTQWSRAGVPGLDLQIYTTSRIFVVVILFGAGTDYCLFLISRLREEAGTAPWPVAVRLSLANVSGALLGSALTTIFGLGMLWIADFGKFHHTGPIIAICLSLGLLVCMTLTPALLCLVGPSVYWPTSAGQTKPTPVSLIGNRSVGTGDRRSGRGGLFWNAMAIALTRKPWLTLLGGWLLLCLPAIYGFLNERSVTYDLSGQLSPDASSREGMRLVNQSFGVGQFNPITVLAVSDHPMEEVELKRRRESLVRALYQVPGVRAVRHLGDPLGDFPPDREMGLLNSDAWRRRALQNHRVAKFYFASPNPTFQERMIRLDVVIDVDPFSIEAGNRLAAVDTAVRQSEGFDSEDWRLAYSGTTPSIVDLREVTLSDTRRIKIAVVLSVLVVLVAVIRQWVLSLYLIATVLLSYYATLGLTHGFFRFLEGEEFLGLDWKLPLFLFVILVAVGQDYNVYLVTRIMEEKRRRGSLAAIRRAVARTGGIITACGLVMAATFFSMTASAWWPPLREWISPSDPANVSAALAAGAIESTWNDSAGGEDSSTLRGIVQLGFALGLGVLIDTLYVRTVLVPSFQVLLDRRRRGRVTRTADTPS